MPDTFAARLRSLREKAGLSIPQLSAAAGLPRQTVHKLERGERRPSLETARLLAAALGVRLRAFE
jgi:transcriptional regulator with XRE-family HTH domain